VFAEHGINSIEDLAGCATDDLTDLPERFASSRARAAAWAGRRPCALPVKAPWWSAAT
jgi:hypothetical protein